MPKAKQNKVVPFNNEILVLVGVPGSGKSTYANALVKKHENYIKISRDDIRKMIKDSYSVGEDMEGVVSALQDANIASALSKSMNVVLDNTHCKAKYIKELATKYGKIARISIKVIGAELTIKEIYAQNLKRDKVVPEAVIDQMYKGFKTVIKNMAEIKQHIEDVMSGTPLSQPFIQNPSLPKAIIVDIDGTVAHMGDGRGPFEWHKVGLDEPDENVLSIVRALSKTYEIFFVSGRDGSCRDETHQWLWKYYGRIEQSQLIMRPAGDYRKDSIVKLEIFEREFKDKYYIQMLFDDRDQVVKMYREMGLTVAQVAEGNF